MSESLRKKFQEHAIPHLQRLTAERIRVGLGIASILSQSPKSAHATIIKSMAPIIAKAGYEPFSWTEATLLASLATKHEKFKDPSQIDMHSREVQELNRELEQIFRGINDRTYWRSFQS